MLFSKTKILIIEDHPHYYSGIKNHITTYFKNSEIDHEIDGENAIIKAIRKTFDVIVVDLNLPDMSGIEVIKTLKSQKVSSKFIVNSYCCSSIEIVNLLDIGVDGILQKDDDVNDIILAIEECNKNEKYFSRTILSKIGKYHENINKREFTSREITIIKLLKEGITTAQIADKLCIAESTVNHHKKSIFNKTGAKNSIELINYCNKNELF